MLLVGATRENRAEALRSLGTKLLLAGPIALLLATGFGYLLAGTGLRAVDAMRRPRGGHLGRPARRAPSGELVDSVRNRFAWRAAYEGRPLQVDAPPGLTIDGDRLRLEQALGNLVENALRHGTGTVRIEARVVAGRLELAVSDEGPDSPPSSCRGPSSGSAGRARATQVGQLVSAWPSSTRSPALTGGSPRRRTAAEGAARCG